MTTRTIELPSHNSVFIMKLIIYWDEFNQVVDHACSLKLVLDCQKCFIINNFDDIEP